VPNGSLTISGSSTIGAGTLRLVNSGSSGALTFNSGTLATSGNTVITAGSALLTLTSPPTKAARSSRSATIKAGTLPVSGGTLNLNSNAPGNLATVNATSGGTLTLSSNNTTAATTTNAMVASNAMIWFPPWYRGSSGHELIVFDVHDSTAPAFTTKLDARTGQTGDWSAPITIGDKIYLSSVAYDVPASTDAQTDSRQFRHFMKIVDFAEPANPVIGDEINIPGKLLAVTGNGATLLTVGCGYDAQGQSTGQRAFHASSFDGTVAQLTDQLNTPSLYDPFALDGATLLLGTWPLGSGQTGQIQAWLIGTDGKFALASQVNTPTFYSLADLHGLLVGFGSALPHLFDVSNPAKLIDLGNLDPSEITDSDLSNADGGAGLGIWEPQGDYGVGIVILGN
jgi:hypothetical protein